MNVFQLLLKLLSAAISIYTLLCLVRIFLTWLPNAGYNSFTQFLGQICDPYLNLFRGIRWLVIGGFDFSPTLALCILGAASTLVNTFTHAGRITIGMLLSMILSLAWSIVSSLVVFLIILLAVRLIMLYANKNPDGPIIQALDRAINPMIFRVAGTFFGKAPVSFKKALITSIAALAVGLLAGWLVISTLSSLVGQLPF